MADHVGERLDRGEILPGDPHGVGGEADIRLKRRVLPKFPLGGVVISPEAEDIPLAKDRRGSIGPGAPVFGVPPDAVFVAQPPDRLVAMLEEGVGDGPVEVGEEPFGLIPLADAKPAQGPPITGHRVAALFGEILVEPVRPVRVTPLPRDVVKVRQRLPRQGTGQAQQGTGHLIEIVGDDPPAENIDAPKIADHLGSEAQDLPGPLGEVPAQNAVLNKPAEIDRLEHVDGVIRRGDDRFPLFPEDDHFTLRRGGVIDPDGDQRRVAVEWPIGLGEGDLDFLRAVEIPLRPDEPPGAVGAEIPRAAQVSPGVGEVDTDFQTKPVGLLEKMENQPLPRVGHKLVFDRHRDGDMILGVLVVPARIEEQQPPEPHRAHRLQIAGDLPFVHVPFEPPVVAPGANLVGNIAKRPARRFLTRRRNRPGGPEEPKREERREKRNGERRGFHRLSFLGL